MPLSYAVISMVGVQPLSRAVRSWLSFTSARMLIRLAGIRLSLPGCFSLCRNGGGAVLYLIACNYDYVIRAK
jgi:hypothetical protein